MSSEVDVWEAAKADLAPRGDCEIQLAPLRIASHLSGCGRVSFVAVVQVIAVGLREQLAAYRAAAARLRAELRRRLT
ncbi:MAG: hypothetical protein ACRDNE_14185 [Gaiellaceae bacterium]